LNYLGGASSLPCYREVSLGRQQMARQTAAQTPVPGAAMIPPYAQPVIVVGVTTSQTCLVMRGRLRALRLAGFRVILVASPGPLLDATTSNEGIEAIALPIERAIAPWHDLLALIRLWRLLRKIRPDMVEFSTPKAGLLGLLAAKLCGIPHRVYLLRGLKLETSSGLKRQLLIAAERLACSSAHVVIANSPSLRDKALALRLAPASHLILLGGGSSRGVDVTHYYPGPSSMRPKFGIRKHDPVIGFVGRLTRDKGIAELFVAFEKILPSSPHAWLLLVGWFDAAEDALPYSLRWKLEHHPRILVTGMVSSTADYYRAMDLMVLPTFREGFPNAVLEASASGIPVVTTLATGARDSVVPEVTGILVPPGCPDALAEAVLALLQHPARRRQMGAAARRWVLDNFLETQVLTATINFYKDLLATPAETAISLPRGSAPEASAKSG